MLMLGTHTVHIAGRGSVVCGVQILASISVLPDWKSPRESATKTYTNHSSAKKQNQNLIKYE